MTPEAINKLIDDKIKKAMLFSTTKYGDTPTDALQLVPKKYVSSVVAAAVGTPGGSNTQVQYNNSGSFAGDANFTWNSTSSVLSVSAVNTLRLYNTAFDLGISTIPGNDINIEAGRNGTTGGDVVVRTGGGGGTDPGSLTLYQTGGGNWDGNGKIAMDGTTGNIQAITTGPVAGNTDGGDFEIRLAPGNGTGSFGDLIVDLTGSATTTARNGGFIIIPVTAGTPSGTPTNAAAANAVLVYDNSANKIWAYSGATWRSVALT